MKIFVLHYSKLVDRKKHILEQFNKQGIIDYEFIEKYDCEDLQHKDMLLFDKCMKKSMISLMNKHFYVYKLISEKYQHALILEDDVILNDNFIDNLNNYMTQLPENFDMLFIGDGCNLHIQKNKLIPNKNIYEKCLYPTKWGGDGASRCSDSYIISKTCPNKLCQYINSFKSKIKFGG
jgi:GR25 family glycosyltransferase involved in LPS biosynthesis